MKAIFIIPDLNFGGAERVSVTIAKILKKNNIKVDFLNLGQNEGNLKSKIIPHFKLDTLGKKRVLYSFFSLIRYLSKKKPDIVYTSRIHVALVLLFSSFFFRFKTKIVIRIPTMPQNNLYPSLKQKVKKPFIFFLEKHLYKRANKIITQSEAMKEAFISTYKINKDFVVSIPNPIDKGLIKAQTMYAENPFFKTSSTNYLAVGNICYAKAYDVLIDAFNIVLERDPESHLFILGRDSNNNESKLVMQKAKNNAKINFLGFKENPYIYIKNCSVFVLSSRMEGVPNVLLEAMYLNKPIATTQCVPIIDSLIKDGENGYKVPIEDSNNLALAMQKAKKIKNINNNMDIFSNEQLIIKNFNS